MKHIVCPTETITNICTVCFNIIWSQSVHGRTRHCHCRRRGSLPLETASLMREGQVDPNGLISHIEGGALPPPATKLEMNAQMAKLVNAAVLEAVS